MKSLFMTLLLFVGVIGCGGASEVVPGETGEPVDAPLSEEELKAEQALN